MNSVSARQAAPIDIVSSDRHTVKPWLDARIGVSPPTPDLAQDGYALIGGRVEVISGRPVPALVHRHPEHLITLVAEPQQGGKATQPDDISSGGFSMALERRRLLLLGDLRHGAPRARRLRRRFRKAAV